MEATLPETLSAVEKKAKRKISVKNFGLSQTNTLHSFFFQTYHHYIHKKYLIIMVLNRRYNCN